MNDRGHGGDIYDKEIIFDFSVNVNPLGIPAGVQEAVCQAVKYCSRYPDTECRKLVSALSLYHQVDEEDIVCGNGAADLIYRLVQTIRPKKALVLAPTFSEYQQALQESGCEVSHYCLSQERGFLPEEEKLASLLPGMDMLFLCNPNNPTGLAITREQVEKLAAACRLNRTFLVVDECFCDFLDEPEKYTFIGNMRQYPEVLILRAFTKTYAMAGLRLGYIMGKDAGLMKKLRHSGQPWSVSLLAQEAGMAALREQEYLDKARKLIAVERERLRRGLTELGFFVFPSQVNFLLFKVLDVGRYGNLWERCRDKKILIRDCGNFCGLSGTYRVCVGQEAENRYLLKQLAIIGGGQEQ